MKHLNSQVCVLAALFLSGCNQQNSTQSPPAGNGLIGAEYLLVTEPQDAQGVIDARATASDDQSVVVVGRIGGSANPWVEGRAAFSIVDTSLQACSDKEGDDCPVPWDYCCETDRLPHATALVKIVNASGDLIKTDARQFLQLKELQTVVVCGSARRDESGNLTILASGLHVKS